MVKVVVLFLSFYLTLNGSHALKKDSFIVGGIPANISDFPHQLAYDRYDSGYICGASNIHRLWALTAAHCVDFFTPPEMIQLYGGSSSRVANGRLFFINRYILHPFYRHDNTIRQFDHDVALIEMNPNYPLEGFPNVRPIALPPACLTDCCGVCAGGSAIDVAGWGRIDDGSQPVDLMRVSKPILSRQECLSHWNYLTTRMFCLAVEIGRDTCDGDSGSAVVRDGLQVGVVSFGSFQCGDGTSPSASVRVEDPAIRSFIQEYSGV